MLADLVCPHSERLKVVLAEGRRERHVCGIAAARHEHPTDSRFVVARVEDVPLPAEIDFEPTR
jgi:hypothetical protein